jgi:hypothetical protein
MNVDKLNHTDVVGQEAPENNYIFYLMIYLGLGVFQGKIVLCENVFLFI